MLDTIHYFYEEDITPQWEQENIARSKVREVIYREFYGREYPYVVYDPDAPYDPSQEFSDPSGGSKPYIPPTNPEDLQGIVGSPLG